ncbi:MAG: DUF5685 family protein [Lachnospiraceae bacterium]|nr:DUF5685 family protein [Lachnospiraceae bacterium]
MFGYVTVHQSELKVREYETYRASYCGLCRSLKKRHGRIGQMTLSYDMTFIALLLTGLYEPQTRNGSGRCLAHPLYLHHYRENPYFDYAADMNVMFTWYKCLDDWHDERKVSRWFFAQVLRPKMKKIRRLYPEKAERVQKELSELSRLEQEGVCDVDQTAGHFGEIMAELFAYREDEWTQTLRRMGFYFGKFIYLMDAYEDIEDDLKHGRYNPLADLYRKDTFEEDAQEILKMMMAETSRAFEQLPILEDVEILRNILYAGVWTKYGQIRCSRKESQKES